MFAGIRGVPEIACEPEAPINNPLNHYCERGNMKNDRSSNPISRREALQLTAKGMLAGLSLTELGRNATQAQAAATTAVDASHASLRLRGENMGANGIRVWNPGKPEDAIVKKTLDAIAGAGLKWVRATVEWSTINSTKDPGKNDYDAVKRILDECRKRGLKTLIMALGLHPNFRPGTNLDDQSYVPTNNEAVFWHWATFCAGLARLNPDAIQIWNEPNLQSSYKPFPDRFPDPKGYVKLQMYGYRGIKSANPSVPVITAGLSSLGRPYTRDPRWINAVEFLRACFTANLPTPDLFKNSFDGLAYHPYAHPGQDDWPACTPVNPLDKTWNGFNQTNQIHNVMRQYGVGNRPIWLTEIGSPTKTQDAPDPRGCKDWNQYNQAIRAVDYFRGIDQFAFPLGPVFWYALRDAPEKDDFFGLLKHDFSRKLAYYVIRDRAYSAAR